MWLDALAIAVLLAFAFLGARRGGLATGMGLLAFAGAYAVAIAAGAALGPALAAATGTSELLLATAAGTVAFFVAYGLLSWLGRRLARRNREELGGADRSPRDRFFGALFGSLRGAVVVVLLSWLALWVDALGANGGTPVIPPVGASMAAAVTGSLVEFGVETALADSGTGGHFAARMAARPAAALEDLESLFAAPQMSALRDDTLFWSYVESGAVDTALTRRSFIDIARDDAMRGGLADLGLVSGDAGRDALVFRDEMKEVLREVGPRIRRVRNDPALRALAEDPEVAALLRSGDTLGLVLHPGIRRLAAGAAAAASDP